jgi:type VI protein secretion system component VasK
MLIPRFSIRWLLWLTTFSAAVSLVLSFAVRGKAWALATAAGLWVLVITAMLYAAAFLAAWLLTQAREQSREQGRLGDVPFQAEGLTASPKNKMAQESASDSPPAMTG